MAPIAPRHTQKLTIIAQDPAIRVDGRILTAQVDVPAESLAPGPWGYRVHVIDYDSSTKSLYQPLKYKMGSNGTYQDPFAGASNKTLLTDPNFHAQNVYAIVMCVLARFEHALGRRVSWSFRGHQLKVAPHAFADANAFYSKQDEGLFFGYFPGSKGNVFSCLSHDVVAHETTHALVDGLRERYTDPSSPDQAAFHEGFADVVALLEVFALREVVNIVLDRPAGEEEQVRPSAPERRNGRRLVATKALTPDALRRSVLLGLAKQMGEEMSTVRGKPLRQSARLTPSAAYLQQEEFMEPHRRGEILVAVMMNAFLEVWAARLKALGEVHPGYLDRERVAEEGANAADYLLTMAIRSLDYSMPVHMEFADFACALLTADREIRPDDSTYRFREHLRKSFKAYGILPTSTKNAVEEGLWLPPEAEPTYDPKVGLTYDRTHFESMQRDPDEVFRFIWENRKALNVYEGVYTEVPSVRPCLRIGPDGFVLRETVAEFIQVVRLEARELRKMKIEVPKGMPPDTQVPLYGGGTLIFDEYGRLKFNVHNDLNNARRQSRRLKYLWEYGFFNRGSSSYRHFSHIHRLRAVNASERIREGWY
jgi:hypothetical protein